MGPQKGTINQLIELAMANKPLPKKLSCSNAIDINESETRDIGSACPIYLGESKETGNRDKEVIVLNERNLYECVVWKKRVKSQRECHRVDQINIQLRRYGDYPE